jgi:hypothetical protein
MTLIALAEPHRWPSVCECWYSPLSVVWPVHWTCVAEVDQSSSSAARAASIRWDIRAARASMSAAKR